MDIGIDPARPASIDVPKQVIWGPLPAMAVFLAITVVYYVTAAVSQFDAPDSYDYAWLAENVDVFRTTDNIETGYHMINRCLFLLLHALGLEVTGAQVGQTVATLSAAAGVVLMIGALNRIARLDIVSSLTGGLLLAATYSYWRYASAVEVYTPAIMLILFSVLRLWHAFERPDGEARLAVLAGIAGGFTVVYYQPTVMPVFMATAVSCILYGRWRTYLIFGTAGALTILIAYAGIIFIAEGEFPGAARILQFAFVRTTSELASVPIPLLTRVAKIAALTHHDFLTAQWVYGIDWLGGLIPSRGAEGSIFAARGGPVDSRFFAVTTVFAWALVGWLSLRFVRRPSADRREAVALFAAWLVIVTVVCGILDGTNWEPLIIAVPAWIGAFTILVVAPIVASGRTIVMAPLLAVIVLHNLGAGMLPARVEASDYLGHRAAWLSTVGQKPNDVAVFAQSHTPYVEPRYLRYVHGLKVFFVDEAGRVIVPGRSNCWTHCPPVRLVSIDRFVLDMTDAGGRVFALDDLFNKKDWLTPGGTVPPAVARLRGNAQVVTRTNLVTAYRLTP